MRETLDCGVLMVPPHHGWMHEWIGRHGQALGRLRLYPVHFDEKTLGGLGGSASPPASDPAADPATRPAVHPASHPAGIPAAPTPAGTVPATEVPAELLARLAIPLRRYDVCVLPVTPATVAWTRTALACARSQLHTPLLALARGLKAAAVQDLLGLGLQDFALHRACADELRARLSRLAESTPRQDILPPSYILPPSPTLAVHETMAAYGVRGKAGDRPGGPAAPSFRGERGRAPGSRGDIRHDDRHDDNHGDHHGNRHGNRPDDDPDAVSFLDELGRMRLGPGHAGGRHAASRMANNEPFRVAKSRVVGCFERDYVRTALSRHAGNVASAARASAKHRRAFWALMRKHAIDADPYRVHEDEGDDEEG